MNASHTLVGISLTMASLSALSGCASSGQRIAGADMQPTAAQAGTTSQRRSSSSVLTAAEIAGFPGITNAYEAVQTLRPNFLRTRGSASRAPGFVGAGAEGQATGRRPGQVQGATGSSGPGSREGEAPLAGNRAPEDPGILVYLDRQRYGPVQTLREIPIATVEEIRFLNAGEANNLFGMGHPHGVIQIIMKRGTRPQ
jgi:hypothetical protein